MSVLQKQMYSPMGHSARREHIVILGMPVAVWSPPS